MELSRYLQRGTSPFVGRLGTEAGYILYSNKGRDEAKEFTLSLDSFIRTINDFIEQNSVFVGDSNFDETRWRFLAEKLSDLPSKSAMQVQTKATFCVFCKVIAWANEPKFDTWDLDKKMPLSVPELEITLAKLKELAKNFIVKTSVAISPLSPTPLVWKQFLEDTEKSNFKLDTGTVQRFIASLLTKPFVILTGLSGSGKTKLAQAFATWVCENDSQFKIVPVGADWTNRDPLLGYIDALSGGAKYIKPDNGALDLIIEANKNPTMPYFLILDEMNLSHVERYFADFLSVLESNSTLTFHTNEDDINDVPARLKLPKNLFIVGTVNIDETTYMFSPKVLDRANVIEFRVSENDMRNFLGNPAKIDLDSLTAKGVFMAESFVEMALEDGIMHNNQGVLNNELLNFFTELKKLGAEFGYRSAYEISRFAGFIEKLDTDKKWEMNAIMDAAIMQKLLPKVHGSRRKLEGVLKELAKMCMIDPAQVDNALKPETDLAELGKYPMSLGKIVRMYQNAIANGFTSFAEA